MATEIRERAESLVELVNDGGFLYRIPRQDKPEHAIPVGDLTIVYAPNEKFIEAMEHSTPVRNTYLFRENVREIPPEANAFLVSQNLCADNRGGMVIPTQFYKIL